jgi:DNA-binding beta-propeller fold protein YncE
MKSMKTLTVLSGILVAATLACSSSPAPAAASAPAAPPASAAAPQSYRLLREIPLGGEGGWDYLTLDSAARRLYISRGTRVVVLDVDSEKPVGEIPGTEGVHGIALVPDLHRGFTSNGRSSTVTIFDTGTLAASGTVKVTGENPDAIIYDPASRRVFTFNGRGKNTTAIDAASGEVAGTIPLDGKPEFAAADGRGRVFANIEDKNEIAVIDSRALRVEKTWPLAGCEEPSGLAIDRAHRRLFPVCHNKTMLVLDSETGRIVATLPIGQGVDAAAFDSGTSLAFASNGDGTLTVIQEENPDSFHVVQNADTQRGARTMALDEKTHRVFLATAQFGPPPEAAPGQPRPRPPMVPGSFKILVVGR